MIKYNSNKIMPFRSENRNIFAILIIKHFFFRQIFLNLVLKSICPIWNLQVNITHSCVTGTLLLSTVYSE